MLTEKTLKILSNLCNVLLYTCSPFIHNFFPDERTSDGLLYDLFLCLIFFFPSLSLFYSQIRRRVYSIEGPLDEPLDFFFKARSTL